MARDRKGKLECMDEDATRRLRSELGAEPITGTFPWLRVWRNEEDGEPQK